MSKLIPTLTVFGVTLGAVASVMWRQHQKEVAEAAKKELKEDKTNPYILKWDFYSKLYGCPTIERTVDGLCKVGTEQQTIRPAICDGNPVFVISTKKNVFLVYINAYVQLDRAKKTLTTVPEEDALAVVINRNAIKATSW